MSTTKKLGRITDTAIDSVIDRVSLFVDDFKNERINKSALLKVIRVEFENYFVCEQSKIVVPKKVKQ